VSDTRCWYMMGVLRSDARALLTCMYLVLRIRDLTSIRTLIEC
jgi:hypothetical protein